MRFMMLMIPKGYEKAAPDAMPDPSAVAAMMKYNETLQKAGVLLRSTVSIRLPAACRLVFGGKGQSNGRAVYGDEGRHRGLLDDPGAIKSRSD